MPDFDPDAYLTQLRAQPNPAAGGFDPDAYLASLPRRSLLESAVKPITDIPGAYSRIVNESVEQMGRGVEQIKTGEPLDIAKGIGNLALGGAGYVGAPISAPIHTIVGEPVAQATGSPLLGTSAEVASSFALPVPKGLPRPAAVIPEQGLFGVTLSAGERANNLAMRQREQSAIRSGEPNAQAWTAQRQAELAAAKEGISRSLDPFGQEIAESPQQAGALVSQSVQAAAASRKAAVTGAYEQARTLPGEIHPSVFQNMGTNIKTDLSARDSPVIIDDKLTPFASQAIQDIDNRVSQLRIQNRADPNAPPAANTIAGINLEGVDQMRKRLSSFARGAFSSGNAADGRAAQAVLDAFDRRVDTAINGGMFDGDPRAVQAWNDARAAYRDYRGTFTSGKNDPAGRVVEKIVGANAGGKLASGPAIPNDVADYLYGAQGVNPSSLNVGVANRVRDILGDQSPEWYGVKQGLFRRLVEPPQGATEWGTGQVANRLNKFLNGDGTELAQTVYSPQERAMLQSYADLMRKITMPPGSYAPSEPAILRLGSALASRIGGVLGAIVGRSVSPFPLVGELAGYTLGKQAERMAENRFNVATKQLPIVAQQWQRWSRAQSAAAAQPANPLLGRAAVAATANLQRTLTPLGIELKDLTVQGPGTANANPDQQGVPRPPGQ